MSERIYDPSEGEFVDFDTLADWEARDKAQRQQITTLQSQCARLKEALEEIAASDSDDLLNPHSNEGRVLTVCTDIASAALQDEAKSDET